MNAYFFKMTKEEKENILDQHKSLYDGYVTKYNQESNQYPLYVQDLANDKNGVTLNNAGTVKGYTNVGINESALDHIGDGPTDLKNGTVDLDQEPTNQDEVDSILMHDRYPSPNEDESEFLTFGRLADEMRNNDEQYEYDIDQLEDYSSEEMGEEEEEENESYIAHLEDNLENVDEDIIPDLVSNLQESLDMFKRFKKYN